MAEQAPVTAGGTPQDAAHQETWRQDVAGLRAWAVLLVVGFHAAPGRVPGGFVGVDVFFVISGFLITRILVAQHRAGTFSVAAFYRHRVARIFPALAAVLVGTTALGFWRLTPVAFGELAADALAGAGFVANVWFWKTAGYFGPASESRPLLHLWSLGVEEQFYLLWPLALALAARRRRGIPVLLACASAGSLGVAIHQVMGSPAAAFYLLPSRVWELGVGGGLACLAPRAPGTGGGRWRVGASWLGMGLVVGSAWGITGHTPFPGLAAIPPVLGAALLIWAGPEPWPTRVLLNNRLAGWVGQVSYSFYLWHWPLLVLLRVSHQQPTSAQRLAAVAGALVLAGLTYRFVEGPGRALRATSWGPAWLTGVLAVAGVLGWALQLGAGAWRWGLMPEERAVLTGGYDHATPYRAGTCFVDVATQAPPPALERCVERAPGDARLVVLWGDSHAAHLYPGLQAQRGSRRFALAQFTATQCPPLLEGDTGTMAGCPAYRAQVLHMLAQLRPQVVILASRWSREGDTLGARVSATVAHLKANGVEHVALVGPPPRWDPNLQSVLWQARQELGVLPSRLTPPPAQRVAMRHGDEVLRQAGLHAGAQLVSLQDLLCDARDCVVRLGPGRQDLVASDHDHFTVAASRFVVAQAADALGLPPATGPGP